eukprot:13528480-Heterocapsa_arctica.AAC.1
MADGAASSILHDVRKALYEDSLNIAMNRGDVSGFAPKWVNKDARAAAPMVAESATMSSVVNAAI